ncbi:bifunctional solanapyrone synthase [Staphylotrichum tortipilum]|uniref:Bifunctional solanapyrone synthase n=1 Tax=Staphylotrichum tortipilum TaxID=2831512 RepID=A0AAN6MIV8_9PEZI|nr:bifunctional solanapyrone synthase [Staphylotrichum longicolle]
MAPLLTLLGIVGCSFALADDVVHKDATATCNEIEHKISKASDVIYPIQIVQYHSNQHHWILSSSNNAACVVEVGSPEDVSLVLQTVGASRTPFAVYSGGHASNPGFSSTKGVHISLRRFDQVELSKDGKIATLGFGQEWMDVYNTLSPSGVNVVGGRLPGPGVGGVTLGGGYSWKTNQYGMTVDTVKTFHVVLPNGTITSASNHRNQDLFFALKGGLNRFGIVTSAEFYTHPQPSEVWGGFRLYLPGLASEVLNATQHFVDHNKDPRTQLILSLDATALGVSSLPILFHDGPNKPADFNVFDRLLTVVDNTGRKPFANLVAGFPFDLVVSARGTFASFSTTALTPRFLEAVKNEAAAIGRVSGLHSGTRVNFDLEPFANYGQYATDCAYPHADSLLPLHMFLAWTNPADDEWWYERIHQAVETLKQVGRDEGIYQDSFPEYPNYALAGTSTEKLYGTRNAARLREIRERIDPERVMDLAGGFEI